MHKTKTKLFAEGTNPSFEMRLYLMRHGIAIDREDPDCPEEAQRYLTPKGVQRTRSAAYGLAELGVRPTGLLTSPLIRAVQTAEIVCEALDIDPKDLRVTDALKPSADPARLLEELQHLPEQEVMCFGHAPHLDAFIARIVGAISPFTEMKKAGVACLEMETLLPPQGVLAWLLTSKALRHLGD
jgi:phosphohistidine phosphatase